MIVYVLNHLMISLIQFLRKGGQSNRVGFIPGITILNEVHRFYSTIVMLALESIIIKGGNQVMGVKHVALPGFTPPPPNNQP
jgi:hypothetical protein